MKFYYDLYVDEKLISKKEIILKKLENDETQFEKYVIALAKNEKGHLYFFNSVLLLQKAVSKDDLFVVGISSGYDETLEMIEKITQEVYDETQGVDIRTYILQKQKKYEEGNV